MEQELVDFVISVNSKYALMEIGFKYSIGKKSI